MKNKKEIKDDKTMNEEKCIVCNGVNDRMYKFKDVTLCEKCLANLIKAILKHLNYTGTQEKVG